MSGIKNRLVDLAEDDWESKKLEDLVDRKSSRIDVEQKEDGPYIGMKHIQTRIPYIEQYGDVSEVVSQKYEFSEGDILFGRLGPHLEKSAVADKSGVCSTEIWVFEPKSDIVNEDYLFYILFHPTFFDIADSLATGTTHSRVKWTDAKDIRIPLPPKHIQETLGSLLSNIDEDIKIEKEIQNQIIEISEKIYENEFDLFEDSQSSLLDLFKIDYGHSFNSEMFNENEGIPLIRIRNISDGYTNTYTSEVVQNPPKSSLGDVLLGLDGDFKVGIWGEQDALINQRVAKFTPRFDINNLFTYITLSKCLYELQKKATGTTVDHLGKDDFSSFNIKVPEESKIIEFENSTKILFERYKKSIQKERLLESKREEILNRIL